MFFIKIKKKCDFYHYLICNYRARAIQSLPFEQPDSPINWWFGLATTKSCLYLVSTKASSQGPRVLVISMFWALFIIQWQIDIDKCRGNCGICQYSNSSLWRSFVPKCPFIICPWRAFVPSSDQVSTCVQGCWVMWPMIQARAVMVN